MNIKHEPAAIGGAIIAILETGLLMLIALDIVSLDDGQMAAIMAFVAALIPVVVNLVVRETVIPVAKVQTYIRQERERR